MLTSSNPFHAGELKAQARAGKTDVPEWAAGFIRPFMPDQHRDFFEQLPFLVLAGADAQGRAWVTLVDGPEHFIRSPDATTLSIDSIPDAQDPLVDAFSSGTRVGLLGIELETRRRNRASGHLRQSGAGFVIDILQSFGNCPQYIHARSWRRAPEEPAPDAVRSRSLSEDQSARIAESDTLFIGSGYTGQSDEASHGYDASHRGGDPGFVQVVDANHLRIPDYAGNNFFNTIGNLIENPTVGLVFVDFKTGGLLHITGQARINWNPQDNHDPSALRMIDVTIDEVLDRPRALSLRWAAKDSDMRELVVTAKIKESEEITSFYLTAADGEPLPSFKPGQHLPVEIDVPGQAHPIARSYSLSGDPAAGTYRLSIKREAAGLVSRHMHDTVEIGDSIMARAPSGDFVVPGNTEPLVLVSAGVGLTPMVSALHASVGGADRAVWFVHGARDGAHHALKSEVDRLIQNQPNATKRVHYSQPQPEDKKGQDFDDVGRVTARTLLDLHAGPDAHYMLCGPARFLADIRAGLETSGVPENHIHFETFGPTG